MSIVKSVKARDLKVEILTGGDSAALRTALQDWFDARTEEVIISLEFETAAAGDNRAYILYTE